MPASGVETPAAKSVGGSFVNNHRTEIWKLLVTPIDGQIESSTNLC